MESLFIGPLTYTHNGITYAIGVVSFGGKCGDPGKFGVYAKISSVLDWIKKNMNKRYRC